MNIADFIIRLGFTLLETAGGLMDFLLREYTVGFATYSVYELLFGGALFVILGYLLISKIIDILP